MENKWISVKKKLPEYNEIVIVGCKARRKDERWVCCGELNHNGKWYNQFQDSESDAEIYPTHWQPLPNPPQQ